MNARRCRAVLGYGRCERPRGHEGDHRNGMDEQWPRRVAVARCGCGLPIERKRVGCLCQSYATEDALVLEALRALLIASGNLDGRNGLPFRVVMTDPDKLGRPR